MMKTFNKLFCVTLLVAGFSACASEFDNDFHIPEKPADVVKAEQLNSYKTLAQYVSSNFAIGNTMTSAEFLKESTPTSLTLTNFNELTISDAFLHSKLVNATGEVDVAAAQNVVDLAKENNLKLYGGTLISSTNNNESYLINSLPGKVAEAYVLKDFEDEVIGAEYPFGYNGETRSDKGASVVEDPEGKSGHCLHVACGLVFPVITFNLAKGTTLGDYIRMEMDWYAENDGGMNSFAGCLHTWVKDSGHDYPTPASMGCKLKEWGKVTLDLTAFNFDDAKKAWASLPFEFGMVSWWQQFYVDNIKLFYTYNQPDFENEKSRKIADDAMKTYVQSVIDTYGEEVSTWTVADHPVSSPATMYWKRLLGDTYFGKAAQYAREVNANLKLFVSEEGLDDANRLANLIAIIAKAENEGAKIDGIEVLLDAKNVNQNALNAMFKTLASTGKMIRLSGLATTGDDASDATALKTILSQYKTVIPEAQRYGITFGNAVSQLWDNSFNRRETYGGVVEGL